MSESGKLREAVGKAVEQATIFRAMYVAGAPARIIALVERPIAGGRDKIVGETPSFERAFALAQRLTRRARGRAALEAMRQLGAAP